MHDAKKSNGSLESGSKPATKLTLAKDTLRTLHVRSRLMTGMIPESRNCPSSHMSNDCTD
jgi:hypothetical protein